MKYIPFLKWWLLFTVICVVAIFVQYAGFYSLLWEKDSSYLSWGIFCIFAFFSIVCGSYIFSTCKSPPKDEESFEDCLRQEEVGWFFSEFCLTLGMIGTIVGFIFMLSGFEGIDTSKPQTVQLLLSDLGKSMATALYTTLVGLICGSLLKIQYFILSLELKKINLVFSPSPILGNSQNPKEETLLDKEADNVEEIALKLLCPESESQVKNEN